MVLNFYRQVGVLFLSYRQRSHGFPVRQSLLFKYKVCGALIILMVEHIIKKMMWYDS